jgi:hypothetical protein
MRFTLPSRTLLAATLVTLAAPFAFAGPPLVCHPLDIGPARSLPWRSDANTWKGARSDYNLARLTGDTLALLAAEPPIIVRMETLRRAAIYASGDVDVARDLLKTLLDRADAKGRDPLAAFDAGYLVETYRQIVPIAPAIAPLVEGRDGYALVMTSVSARPHDPAMQFAAAMIAAGQHRAPSGTGPAAEHVRAARAGASSDALLAKNVKWLENR